jgi:hypothetical protein
MVPALFLGCVSAYAAEHADTAVMMYSGESMQLYAGAHTFYCERHNRAMRRSFKTDFQVAEGETWTATCVQGRMRFDSGQASG